MALEAGQTYVIIPCTYSPNEEATWRVFIISEGRLTAYLASKETEWNAIEIEVRVLGGPRDVRGSP